MHLITKTMETETGHRLPDYFGKCGHLHGHTYKWEVEISGPNLNKNGFVMDFSDLKEILQNSIGKLDHAFVLSSSDRLFSMFPTRRLDTLFMASNGKPGRLIVLDVPPSVENLTKWVGLQIQRELEVLEDYLVLVQVSCFETSNSKAVWVPDSILLDDSMSPRSIDGYS